MDDLQTGRPFLIPIVAIIGGITAGIVATVDARRACASWKSASGSR